MTTDSKVQDAIKDDESLKIFLRNMDKFNKLFCEYMMKGSDFNVKLEVRGNKSELLYARVNTNNTEQPRGAQKRIDEKSS